MSADTRIRWTDDEWQAVAAQAVRLLAKGLGPTEAMEKAQKTALPKARRRESLRPWSAVYRRFLEEAQAAFALEERPAPPAARVKLDEGRDYSRPGQLIRWTTREKALIARQVAQWRDQGDVRALSRLFIEAQELVLPEDRRRPVTSIQAGVGKGGNDKILEEGLHNAWLVAPPPAEAEPEPQTAAEPAAAPEAPAESQAPAEPQATPAPARGLSDAAQAFGQVVMGAFDTLLARHTDVLLSHLYEKLSEQAATSAAQIAAMIERGMRETVHKLIESELGPVASPPAPPPAPVEAVVAPSAPASTVTEPEKAKPKVKVDVVGFDNGVEERTVVQAINGSADLRFVNLHRESYAPHRGRHCIMMAQKLPHAVKSKIKAAGIEPIYVRSTTGHVIHAIEALLQAAP